MSTDNDRVVAAAELLTKPRIQVNVQQSIGEAVVSVAFLAETDDEARTRIPFYLRALDDATRTRNERILRENQTVLDNSRQRARGITPADDLVLDAAAS